MIFLKAGVCVTEFVIIVANSQRPPYTLRADSPQRVSEWVEAIEMHAPLLAAMQGGGDISAAEPGMQSQ